MRIEIRRSRWNAAVGLLIPVPIVLGGLYMLINPSAYAYGDHSPFLDGFIVVGVGLVALFFVLKEIADRRPFLIIDDQGVKSANLSGKNIPWSEIKAVSMRASRGGAYLVIEVADPDKYYPIRRGYGNIDRWADRAVGDRTVTIGGGGLEMPIRDIRDLIHGKIGASIGSERS